MWKSMINLMLSAMLMAAVPVVADEASAPSSASKSMEWQMMPGESLNSLARLFYPKSTAMQQSFVKSAIKLNRETMPELTSGYTFDANTTVLIPSLIELSRHAPKKRKHKPAAVQPAVTGQPAVVEPEKQAPPSLGKEQTASVKALEQRVEQRQKDLDKLNERVKSLESEAKTLQDTINANSKPIEEAKGRQLKRVE